MKLTILGGLEGCRLFYSKAKHIVKKKKKFTRYINSRGRREGLSLQGEKDVAVGPFLVAGDGVCTNSPVEGGSSDAW